MKYTTRDAKERDKAWLDNLRRDVYRDLFFATWGSWDEERHNRHFTSSWEMGNIKIIQQDMSSIGMLQVFDAGEHIEIVAIQIAPLFQRRGVATEVLSDILTDAQKHGKKVLLSTGLKNIEALKLYQRLGFIETKRTDTKVYLERVMEKD